MLRLASERETLKVVGDRLGAPTSARMIADISAEILREALRERDAGQFVSGIFHLTAQGSTNWHGFASRIVEAARAALPEGAIAAREIVAIASSDYPTPARRQSNSRWTIRSWSSASRFGASRGKRRCASCSRTF